MVSLETPPPVTVKEEIAFPEEGITANGEVTTDGQDPAVVEHGSEVTTSTATNPDFTKLSQPDSPEAITGAEVVNRVANAQEEVVLTEQEREALRRTNAALHSDLMQISTQQEAVVANKIDSLLEEGRTPDQIQTMLDNGEIAATVEPPIGRLRLHIETIEAIEAGLQDGKPVTQQQAVWMSAMSNELVRMNGMAHPDVPDTPGSDSARTIIENTLEGITPESALAQKPRYWVELELGNGVAACSIGDSSHNADPVRNAARVGDIEYISNLSPSVQKLAAAQLISDPVSQNLMRDKPLMASEAALLAEEANVFTVSDSEGGGVKVDYVLDLGREIIEQSGRSVEEVQSAVAAGNEDSSSLLSIEGIKSVFNDYIGNPISGLVTDGAQLVQSSWDNFSSAVQNFVSVGVDSYNGFVDQVWTTAGSWINNVGDAFNSAGEFVANATGFDFWGETDSYNQSAGPSAYSYDTASSSTSETQYGNYTPVGIERTAASIFMGLPQYDSAVSHYGAEGTAMLVGKLNMASDAALQRVAASGTAPAQVRALANMIANRRADMESATPTEAENVDIAAAEVMTTLEVAAKNMDLSELAIEMASSTKHLNDPYLQIGNAAGSHAGLVGTLFSELARNDKPVV